MFWSTTNPPPPSKAESLLKETEEYISKATDVMDRLQYATLIRDAEERRKTLDTHKEELKGIQKWGTELTNRIGEYIKEEKQSGNVRNFRLNKIYLEGKRP